MESGGVSGKEEGLWREGVDEGCRVCGRAVQLSVEFNGW